MHCSMGLGAVFCRLCACCQPGVLAGCTGRLYWQAVVADSTGRRYCQAVVAESCSGKSQARKQIFEACETVGRVSACRQRLSVHERAWANSCGNHNCVTRILDGFVASGSSALTQMLLANKLVLLGWVRCTQFVCLQICVRGDAWAEIV